IEQVAVAEAPEPPFADTGIDEDDFALAVDREGEHARLLHLIRGRAVEEGRPRLLRHLGKELRGCEAEVGVTGSSNLNVTDADLFGHDDSPPGVCSVLSRHTIRAR